MHFIVTPWRAISLYVKRILLQTEVYINPTLYFYPACFYNHVIILKQIKIYSTSAGR